jgi:hypothetical protein
LHSFGGTRVEESIGGERVNRKLLVVFVALMAVAMLATPLAVAKPGAEKNNEKFEYFKLVCTGADDGTSDKSWDTYLHDIVKTGHGRGAGWTVGPTVALTVGDETFDGSTVPYSVAWDTTYDIEVFFNNDGSIARYNIKLTDVVTVYDEGAEIGTLVLSLTSYIVFEAGAPVKMAGTVVGYGTEELKGVHISAVDTFDMVNLWYARVGTITGWPAEITNP